MAGDPMGFDGNKAARAKLRGIPAEDVREDLHDILSIASFPTQPDYRRTMKPSNSHKRMEIGVQGYDNRFHASSQFEDSLIFGCLHSKFRYVTALMANNTKQRSGVYRNALVK
jgi:hypothetical protein